MLKTKESPSRRRRIMQALIAVAAVPCVIYVALLTYLYFNQRSMIFPGSAAQYQGGEWTFNPPIGCEYVKLPTKQGNIAVIFGRALTSNGQVNAHGEHLPTVFYFYGNAGSIASSFDQIYHFQKLGYNVITPDYHGFGLSAGAASEKGCYEAAEAAYQYSRTRPEVDPGKLVFAGWSLGSAVAIDLASKHRCAALITFSAFTSMAEMANSQYPIVPLPIIRVILKYRFLSEAKIQKIPCPVLIGHSHGDRFVPYAMADRLAAHAGGPATRLNTTSSDHSDFFLNDSPLIFDTVGKFVRANVR